MDAAENLNIMKSRLLSSFLALYFLFASSFSFALIPLIPGVAPLATYLGATAGLATAIDYSIALHAAVLAISLNNDQGDPSTGAGSTPLTVYLNPKTPLTVPSGWTSGTSSSVQPVPPASKPATANWKYDNKIFSDSDSAARAYVAQYYSSWTFSSSSEVPFNGTLAVNAVVTACGGGCSQTLQYVAIQNFDCEAGYTKTGSTCNLSDASVVSEPSDNHCSIMRAGNAFSVNSRDPDCSTLPPTVSNGASFITKTRPDGSNVTVTLNADSTTTVSESYPDIASGSTKGLISNFSAPNPDTGEVTLTGLNTGSVQGVGTGITPPSSSTGDSQKVVDKMNQDNAEAASAAAGNGTLPENPSTVAGLGLPTTNNFDSTLPSSLTGLLMPSSGSGGCVGLDASLPILGSFTISPCAVVDAVRPLVNFLLISLSVIGAVFVWLRPDGDTA